MSSPGALRRPPFAALLILAACAACRGEAGPAAASSPAARHIRSGEASPGRGSDTEGGPSRAVGAPSRILSLAPSVTEILFAIGAGGQVVGVDAFSDFPPEARSLPKLGGLLDPDLEGMLRLRPDLAILLASQAEVARSLEAAGVTTLAVPHEDLADVLRSIREIGRRTGRAGAAGALADSLHALLERGRARTPQRARPRVLFVVAREPGQVAGLTAAGGRTYIDELIELAGGRNVLAGSSVRYPQLSAESLLRLRPEVILEWSMGAPAGDTDDGRAQDRRAAADWRRLPAVPAVVSGRVHMLHEEFWLRPGPRVGEALPRLKALLAREP